MGTTPTTSDSYPRAWGAFWLHHVLDAGHMGVAFAASRSPADPADRAVQVPTPAQLSLMRRVGMPATGWMRADWPVLATLDDAHLLRVLGVGLSDDVPYVEFELPDGVPANALVGLLRPSEALELVRQGAAGVGALHHAGYVHAHLTPGSLRVAWDGRVKVAELGIAHTLDAQLTASNPDRPTGTPSYLAPERYEGRSTPASDVFSLGCILYQLVAGDVLLETATGRAQPFRSARLDQFLTGACADRLDAHHPGLASLLRRCVAHDPAERWIDGAALSEAITGLLDAAQAADALRERMEAVHAQLAADPNEPDLYDGFVDAADPTQPEQAVALAEDAGPPVWAGASGATVAPSLRVDATPLGAQPGRVAARPAGGPGVGVAALAFVGLLGGGLLLGWQTARTDAPRAPDPAPVAAAPVAPATTTAVAPAPPPAEAASPALQTEPSALRVASLPAPIAPIPAAARAVVRPEPAAPRPIAAPRQPAAPPLASPLPAAPMSLVAVSAPVAAASAPAPSPWIDTVAPLPWYTVDDLARARDLVGSPASHGKEVDAILADTGNTSFGPLRAAVSSSDPRTVGGFVGWLDSTGRLAPFLSRARRGTGGAYGPTFSAAVATVARARFAGTQDFTAPDQGARCDAAEHVWVAMMVDDQRRLAGDWQGVCASCASGGHTLQSCDARRLAAAGVGR